MRMDSEGAQLLEQELKNSATDGGLKCSQALGLARRLDVSSGEVGGAVNRMEIRIVDCQLGCFIVAKATHDDLADKQVDKTLADAVKAATVDGHLPCTVALEVAGTARVTPKQVGDVATMEGVKISQCQLGCFP